jgi:hypothetical protein
MPTLHPNIFHPARFTELFGRPASWLLSLCYLFAVFLIVDPSYSFHRRLTEKISRFRLTTAQRFFPVLQ